MSASGPASQQAADDDFAAIAPTVLSRAAGAMLLLSGVFTSVLGAQTAMVFRLRGLPLMFTLLLLGLGLTTLVAGWRVLRMRGQAAMVGTASAALAALLTLIWAGYSLLQGVFSLLALGDVPLGVVAAALSGVCIAPGRRADRARERLRELGYETGA